MSSYVDSSLVVSVCSEQMSACHAIHAELIDSWWWMVVAVAIAAVTGIEESCEFSNVYVHNCAKFATGEV